MATHTVQKLTPEEYLVQERANPYKSEYIGGEMLAMAGGSFRHAALSLALGGELRSKLAGSGCTVLSSDTRVHIPADDSYVYPDVSVVCGPLVPQPGTTDVLANPALVCEVLSPSTRDYDQGRKFDLYREITTLREYLLVHVDSIKVGHYLRQADDSWLFREYRGPDASVSLASVGVTLSLAALYGDLMNLPL